MYIWAFIIGIYENRLCVSAKKNVFTELDIILLAHTKGTNPFLCRVNTVPSKTDKEIMEYPPSVCYDNGIM